MRLLIAAFGLVLFSVVAVAQESPKQTPKNVPKYNAAAEAVYKGTVDDLRERQCPVSGGMMMALRSLGRNSASCKARASGRAICLKSE